MNATEINTTNATPQDSPQDSPDRCQHRTLKGRCRQAATDSAGTLCFHHARAQRQAQDDFTLLEPLIRKPKALRSVEGISNHLAALQNLLAEGRVSPRRASVIAYIDSLLLRTFVELQEQNKGNLNYYGQPIPKYDWSSFPDFKRNSVATPLPEAATNPTSTPQNAAGSRREKDRDV